MSVSSIYKLLDKLEMIVLKGLPIPLTPMVFVNHEKIIDVLDKIRASIPGEIQEAHAIIKKSDDIQNEAQRQAANVMNDAKSHAASMLNESEILKAVQSEAERIRQQVIADCEAMKKQAYEEAEGIRNNAINEAIGIREGADKYAETVLGNLDRDLTELHGIVKNGQQHLSKIRSEVVSQNNQEKQPV